MQADINYWCAIYAVIRNADCKIYKCLVVWGRLSKKLIRVIINNCYI